MASTRFDLLRHGEPEGGRRYRGQSDDPLSPQGWQEMWQALGACRDWTRLLSSPLSRCRAFAEALAQESNLPLEIDNRLMEIGFGTWEGRTSAELQREDPEQLARFYADPVNARPEGAEPLADFIARIRAGWHDALRVHAGERVLLVAHAGTIRAIIADVLELPEHALYRVKVPYAALTRIEIESGRPPALIFHHGCL